MDATSLKAALAPVGANGFVTAKDVLRLRREIFTDGVVSSDELDALFELGERAPEGDREWIDFFGEAAADFYLREEEPHGYLTEEEFRSLKARVTKKGVRASALELEMLLRLLEKSTETPDGMSEFVGREIKRLIAERRGGPRVVAGDVQIIRRFLFAAGGAGNVAVTRKEAELLFDLNDLVDGAKNDPDWSDLFVKAIANHLMAHIGYAPTPREEALRRQAFIADRAINLGGFFRRMISGAARGSKGDEKSLQAARNEARERDAAEAELITATEADWLADRIGRDGSFAENERALFAYLKRLDANLPPRLKDLAESAA